MSIEETLTKIQTTDELAGQVTDFCMVSLQFNTGVLDAAQTIQDEIDNGDVVLGNGTQTQTLVALLGLAALAQQARLVTLMSNITGRSPESIVDLITQGADETKV